MSGLDDSYAEGTYTCYALRHHRVRVESLGSYEVEASSESP